MSMQEEDVGKRRVKKPGLNDKNLSALQKIALARAQGTSRISQYALETAEELNKHHESEGENDSYDEKEFVEYGDEYERRLIEEDDEEQDYTEAKPKKKNNNTKKKGAQAPNGKGPVSKPADNQTILKYAKTTATIGQNKPKPKNEKNKEEMKLKSENILAELMNNIYDGKGDHEVLNELESKEDEVENQKLVFKSKVEREKDKWASEILQASKNKELANQAENAKRNSFSKEDTNKNNENDKKRKRDEFVANMDLEEISDFSNMSAIDNILAKNKMETIREDEDSFNFNDGIDKILEEQRKNANSELEAKRKEERNKQIIEVPVEEMLTSNQEEMPDISLNVAAYKDYSAFIEEDGSIFFYWIDAYEEMNTHRGTVFLFGKIYNRRKGFYETACISVKNIERQIFFCLKPEYENEKDINEKVYPEINSVYSEHVPRSSLGKFSAKEVVRQYAFQLDVPREKRTYIKVNYSFESEALPFNLRGKTFDFVLGTTYSALELFLIKRKIRGPCWLRVVNYSAVPDKSKHSWCAHEFNIPSKKNIGVLLMKGETLAPPPLRLLSLSLKSYRNQESKLNEIVGFSCAFLNNVDIDTVKENSKKPYYFNGIRKLGKGNFPKDFEGKRREKEKVIELMSCDSENKLLEYLVTKINQFDPDVIVGHDLYGKVFDLLIERVLKLKIPLYNLSKVGRLKKSGNLQKSNGNIFRTRYITSGRLLCDTYAGVREIIRETDYSLGFLAKKYLNSSDHEEIDSETVEQCFSKTSQIFGLIDHTMKDAFLTQELNFKFQMLPLTKQLTCLAGNLWIKSLQNARAERNEMLLIHEFHKNKYIWPDKFSTKMDKMSTKDLLEEGTNMDEPAGDKKKKKKKKYAGGLVLEPKTGLYESIILLLDFNSLYPSIIQEFNLCFTTGKRKALSLEQLFSEQLNIDQKRKGKKKENAMETENEVADEEQENQYNLEDELIVEEFDNKKDTLAILPTVIKALVEKRRQVKNMLKNETNEERKINLDIRQKAIKLIANSIYGCLGFANSRFYSKPIAAYITRKGRETLESSVKLVTGKLNYEVIYGDTDSIMINTQSDDFKKALTIGNQIKIEINKQFKNRTIEIDIDGIFMPLLLIKKKKYAAMKVSNLGEVLLGNGAVQPKFYQEIKGLDMVRRDWCDLAKKCSKFALDTILSGEAKEECQVKIGDYLKTLNEEIKYEPEKRIKDFILTKQLTKKPTLYPDGDNQPHVAVAKRLLLNKGESEQNLVNRFIQYLICKKDSDKLADRAFHMLEYKDQNLEIDQNYYKVHQIMPPISRICEFIQGINISYFAECLELGGGRYTNYGKKDRDNFQEEIQRLINEEEEEEEEVVHDKMELQFKCLKCNHEEPYLGVFRPNGDIGLICPKCKKPYEIEIVLNRVLFYVKQKINEYYEGCTLCLNEFCSIQKTKQLRYKSGKCISFICQSEEVVSRIKEKRICDNLNYLKSLFELKKKDKLEESMNSIYKHYESSFNIITEKIKEIISRNKIHLGKLFSI